MLGVPPAGLGWAAAVNNSTLWEVVHGIVLSVDLKRLMTRQRHYHVSRASAKLLAQLRQGPKA
jgi:hypothetical protein